jgi:hypothetical protein
MKLKRDLGMHACYSCGAAVGDIDFVRIGIVPGPTPQIYAEYHCPRCAHHGRYVYPAHGCQSSRQALQFLIGCIDDADETAKEHRDWDKIDWNGNASSDV